MTISKSVKEITSANRQAWEEVAPIHGKENQATLLEEVRQAGYSCLIDVEKERLEALNVVGKDVAQVCCNNGRELISVKNMGAGRCVGFDGAQGFINQGNELAQAAGLDVEFVCTDIYEIDEKYTRKFDIVTITNGVISWMPDLEMFFKVVARLLKPGGCLFMFEQHPLLNMVQPDEGNKPIVWELSYFDKDPYVETEGLDYYRGEKYEAKPATTFSYTLSDILMAGINNGLDLEFIEELPLHVSNIWKNVEESGFGFPMSFTLVMRKKAP
ncbi:class I SAM-dependent methyltransferase [Terasakiella pusilla]|uniref:class I SAM-dependent methyltransferase n=1 Tax=Terasakiella pusilla TaxID=64973 RepID=UPI00056EEF84|nr:class I SAM-dependent methyltransferase [Terasakiella pusilla]